MDLVTVQRPLHLSAALRNGRLRPIYLRSSARQIPTALSTWSKKNILQDALVLFLGWERLLPLTSRLHFLVLLLLRRSSTVQRPDWRPLALGDDAVQCCPRRCSRESSARRECLDQIHGDSHSGVLYRLDDLHSDIRHRRTHDRQWPFKRAAWTYARHVYLAGLLCVMSSSAAAMFDAGLCVEVRQTHVFSTNLPPCAGDSEVQCAGLQAPDGAIPEGGAEGTTGATNAQAARLCF